ncbi:hypothetical protein STRIP9103_09707, partial [Streptomyces ipomoeae 91-03]
MRPGARGRGCRAGGGCVWSLAQFPAPLN